MRCAAKIGRSAKLSGLAAKKAKLIIKAF